jgi:hypothetical protein
LSKTIDDVLRELSYIQRFGDEQYCDFGHIASSCVSHYLLKPALNCRTAPCSQ